MKPSHRTVLVLVSMLLILPARRIDSAQADENKEKEKAAPLWKLAPGVNSDQLHATVRAIEAKDWENAVRLLQQLLDGNRDTLARLTEKDGKLERYVSVHAEAERLLATLPAEARKMYQQACGPRAAALLDEAREDRDEKQFTRIVERYLYADAGLAALWELARWQYNNGRMFLAAPAYARLREHVGLARWSDGDLYQAAVAIHRRGLSAQSASMQKELWDRERKDATQSIKRWRTLKQLKDEIERAPSSPEPLEWPIYRGDAARSNRGIGGPPLLEPLWRQSMLYEPVPDAAARDQLRQAEKKVQERHETIIPAFSPIAVSGQGRDRKDHLVVCKNYFGVMAVDLRNGSLRWASPSNLGLQRMLSQGGSKRNSVTQWLKDYQGYYPQILFENSAINTLSTDGQFVYVVEDLAVPPEPRQSIDNGMIFRGGMVPNQAPLDKDLDDAVSHNRLFALSLARSGALTWALGDEETDPLHDYSFLGPPLPLDGRLYMLVQKKRQMSLLCIDPDAGGEKHVHNPKIVFMKPLVELRTSLVEDPIRRTQAAHFAYGDGILVCPTNAGVVFGVDLLTNRLAWAYPYREIGEKAKDAPARVDAERKVFEIAIPPVQRMKDSPAPVTAKRWKTTAPVIADGKVVFAAPDDPSVHCLNLTDGSLLWSHKKGDDDLYLGGVYGGKVLIVGNKSVKALDLNKGEIQWTQETGLPSGQGIAAGDVYYLPLQRGARSKRPEILVLDINTGRVIAHHPTRPRKPKGDDFEVPGNLVFVDGKLISVAPWELVAYPPRGGK